MGYSVEGLPSDLITSERIGTRRLAVDPQQTSFEENTQYRFFDKLDAVPAGSQLVYKFSSANAVNIFLRSINIWEGGREYIVYPVDGNETFTGTFTDVTDHVFPINGNLRDGLTTHPVSGVTVERAIGAEIFSTTSLPRNGTAALTDGNANRAASAYTANGDRAGVAAGQAFYLVFTHIGANNLTNGLFLLAWEERF